jgi:hypothetical protein
MARVRVSVLKMDNQPLEVAGEFFFRSCAHRASQRFSQYPFTVDLELIEVGVKVLERVPSHDYIRDTPTSIGAPGGSRGPHRCGFLRYGVCVGNYKRHSNGYTTRERNDVFRVAGKVIDPPVLRAGKAAAVSRLLANFLHVLPESRLDRLWCDSPGCVNGLGAIF